MWWWCASNTLPIRDRKQQPGNGEVNKTLVNYILYVETKLSDFFNFMKMYLRDGLNDVLNTFQNDKNV